MSTANKFPGCVLFSRVRLSFPALVTPRSPKGSPTGVVPSYSADFITDPKDPKYAEFVNLCNQLAQTKWGQHYPNIINAIYKDKDRRCFGQGEEKIDGTTYAVYDGYAGQVWVKGSKKSDKGAPQMVGPNNEDLGTDSSSLAWANEARKMYGGCYVDVVLKPWVYDNTFGKGFGADLIAIKWVADGVPFGEAIRDASAMFNGSPVAAPPALGAPQFPPLAAPGFAPPSPAFPAPPQFSAPAFPPVQQPPMAAPGFAPPPQFPPVAQPLKMPWQV